MENKETLKKKVLGRFNVREEDLKKLCQDKGVKSLAIFGSVLRDEFQFGQSDLDFLVEFESISIDLFFEFLEGLKALFHYQEVDLVTQNSLKNTVIRQEVLSTKEDLYAA